MPVIGRTGRNSATCATGDEAREELKTCRQLQKKIQDPRLADTERLLKKLTQGSLTEHSQVPTLPPAPRVDPKTTDSATATGFDVFLSHSSKDKPNVRDLKKRLEAYDLSCWFDEDQLRPGIPWQQLLEEGIQQAKSIAVLIGKDGLGPWEDVEMQAALNLAVKDKRPVIPVLMPDAPVKPALPMFLGNRTWVDLRGGFVKAAVDNLVWGITGKKP